VSDNALRDKQMVKNVKLYFMFYSSKRNLVKSTISCKSLTFGCKNQMMPDKRHVKNHNWLWVKTNALHCGKAIVLHTAWSIYWYLISE